MIEFSDQLSQDNVRYQLSWLNWSPNSIITFICSYL